jgi:hypothetical protein
MQRYARAASYQHGVHDVVVRRVGIPHGRAAPLMF